VALGGEEQMSFLAAAEEVKEACYSWQLNKHTLGSMVNNKKLKGHAPVPELFQQANS